MGPQRFRCGNTGTADASNISMRDFNGATTFPLWKFGMFGSPVVEVEIDFNGATTFPLWKLDYNNAKITARSHFNGATTFPLWKSAGLTAQKAAARNFNGATTFPLWK